MKDLKSYVSEGLLNIFSTKNPKTKERLQEVIYERIKKEGVNCDLNDIDVSQIKDMSYLFACPDEKIKDGTSKPKNTEEKIRKVLSTFNGDISNWNTEKVENMTMMFFNSDFNGDISNWNVRYLMHSTNMFSHSALEGKEPAWYKK